MGEEGDKSPEKLPGFAPHGGQQRRALTSQCWPGTAESREAGQSSPALGLSAPPLEVGTPRGGGRQSACPAAPARQPLLFWDLGVR